MIYLLLFIQFFKTGLFSIGGGLATIPFLKEMAATYQWFSPNELTDMIAVSESTPGAIGVNMSTYAGFHAAGPLGALISTLGLVLPSIIVILVISNILNQFRNSKIIQNGFYGLRPASAGLVLGAMFSIIISVFFQPVNQKYIQSAICCINWKAVVLFCVSLYFMYRFKKLHPILFIAFGAVMGIVFKF